MYRHWSRTTRNPWSASRMTSGVCHRRDPAGFSMHHPVCALWHPQQSCTVQRTSRFVMRAFSSLCSGPTMSAWLRVRWHPRRACKKLAQGAAGMNASQDPGLNSAFQRRHGSRGEQVQFPWAKLPITAWERVSAAAPLKARLQVLLLRKTSRE